ncbi:MAG: precorrin-6y C5,15-methyltransferase (decarboxylating) subunit CbiE [Candidatus Bathyarchaeota archaeon]|nr:precorrin-6y C5,15-methyltransferase (decarboxylating) subunit CbiE [Candidatus Bathyarchaeota archaeon]
MAKLSIVGAGPGSPDYVTPAARKAVQVAQVVVGAQRNLDLFQEDIAGEVVVLTGKNVGQSLRYAVESAQGGKAVAVISTGDPGFSGLLGSVLNRLNGDHVELEVIPGVSSMQACAALLHISWDNTVMLTFHDGARNQTKTLLTQEVKKGKTIILLPEPRFFMPRDIARFLLDLGTDKNLPVAVCESITLPQERLVTTTLHKAATMDFASLCVMVINTPKNMTKGE